MNPSSDIDPLGPDERELARILRALPAVEPSAALDAKILRAAADASASRGRRRSGWLGAGGALWGIGSAAAAVLALGIGWQALYGNHHPTEAASKPVPAEDAAETDGVTVEFKDHSSLADQARNAPATPPPTSAAAPALKRAAPASRDAVAQAPAAAAAASAAAPAPEPFPDATLDEHVARRAEATAADTGAAGSARDRRQANAQIAKAQAARQDGALAGNVAAQAAAAEDQLSAAKATGGAAAMGSAAPAQRQAEPAPRLRPATWLAEVRTLRDQGKTAEARARLVEFRRQYPHWIIPTDLAPLLRE